MVSMNKVKAMTYDEVVVYFVVDDSTGEVYWRKRGMGRHLHKQAGCRMQTGYRKIGMRIEGKYVQFFTHHIVWTWVHGQWPIQGLDHINGIKDDNRPINLRLASTRENSANKGVLKSNTSGFKWVSPRKRGGSNSWQGAVWFGKERKQKYFPTKEAAYEWAHGEFYNPGLGA